MKAPVRGSSTEVEMFKLGRVHLAIVVGICMVTPAAGQGGGFETWKEWLATTPDHQRVGETEFKVTPLPFELGGRNDGAHVHLKLEGTAEAEDVMAVSVFAVAGAIPGDPYSILFHATKGDIPSELLFDASELEELEEAGVEQVTFLLVVYSGPSITGCSGSTAPVGHKPSEGPVEPPEEPNVGEDPAPHSDPTSLGEGGIGVWVICRPPLVNHNDTDQDDSLY